jgi:hypothetical protein
VQKLQLRSYVIATQQAILPFCSSIAFKQANKLPPLSLDQYVVFIVEDIGYYWAGNNFLLPFLL